MELTAEVNVLPGKGLSGAKVVVQLMYVPLREPSNTRDDTFTGLCDVGLWRFIRVWVVSKMGDRHLSVGAVPCQPAPQFFFVCFTCLSRSPS